MALTDDAKILGRLWRQFAPLSLSDVTMAMGDPAITATLSQMPDARLELGAVGVAKSIAVFFESPIIMLLHASNSLAPAAASRRVLWRFMLVATVVLTAAIFVLTLPPVFSWIATALLGLELPLLEHARSVLLLLIVWPAAIAWRRYYQGLLIHGGQARWVGRAGIGRFGVVVAVLWAGYVSGMPGGLLAGVALASGVIAEAVFATGAAHFTGATKPPSVLVSSRMPTSLAGVWRFYWPLANSMLVVWGGRVLLVAVIARALDAPVALAAWPAAWGFVLVVANASRMVQQVIIRNRGEVSAGLLCTFAATVGGALSLLLLIVGSTAMGQAVVTSFVGSDPGLSAAVHPVILATAVIPFLVAVQNAFQGFLIGDGQTQRVNIATSIGTVVLLIAALAGVLLGIAGATAAAFGMVLALVTENAWLAHTFLKSGLTRPACARPAAIGRTTTC